MKKKRKQVRDGVYERPDRKGFWISYFDERGHRRRERAPNAHTLIEARDCLTRKKDEIARNKVLGVKPPSEESFGSLAERYLKHHKAQLTSKRSYEREIGIVENHLKPFFKGRVADIRKVDVQDFVNERALKAAKATVRKEYRCLSHMLSLAVDWEIIPSNPAYKIKTSKPPAGRLRYLQPGEVKALLFACPIWLRPIVGIAVSTGMRRGEILNMRHLDVDLEGGRVLLPQTKNGDARIVYLNAPAKVALQSVMKQDGPSPALIFDGVCADYVTQCFREAVKDTGIEDFTFHDLRHTFASWLVMSGANLRTVADQLGHRDIRMTMRYAHLSASHRANAVNQLDGVFGFPVCHQDVTAPEPTTQAIAVTSSK